MLVLETRGMSILMFIMRAQQESSWTATGTYDKSLLEGKKSLKVH